MTLNVGAWHYRLHQRCLHLMRSFVGYRRSYIKIWTR